MSKLKYFIIVFVLLTFSCTPDSSSKEANPPAEGFNLEGSDLAALKLADSIVLAHGGRKAWDDTNYLKWNFFGSRRHIWNKKTGDVIIEGIVDTFLVKMNIHDMTGKVNNKGEEVTEPDSLAKYLQMGKEMWINDSYWVFLPFKLKDSGVTLKYLPGEIVHDSLGRMERISLTFDEVGVTPQNKYILMIEGNNHHIHQWDFYKNATDVVPSFTTKWAGYKKYGDIMLADKRANYLLTEIAVGDSLAKYFEE